MPEHVEHRHLTRSQENLRLAQLPSLQAGSVEDLLDDLALLAGLEQGVLVSREQSEPVEELVDRLAARIAGAADSHSLEHAAAPKLVEHVGPLKVARHVQAVGLDAPNVVRRGLVEFGHERRELTLERRGDGGELHGGSSAPLVGVLGFGFGLENVGEELERRRGQQLLVLSHDEILVLV